MANEERNEDDIYIKETRRYGKFFITSSGKMTDNKITDTTISSSHYEEMSESFAKGEHLVDDGFRDINGGILYMLQEMQNDIDDIHNEVSASAFQSSFFPFISAPSASFGLMSSSLVPHKDDKYDLGGAANQWKNLYVDGTAYIDVLDLNGTNVANLIATKALKTDITGSFTSLSASIATDIGNAGGGTVDTTLTNGSTNAVTNNAVFDGLALKLNLSGGTMTGAITPRVITITGSPNKGAADVRTGNVLEVVSKQAVTLITMMPSAANQEVTIMNLGQGAITITHANKPTVNGFNIYGGNNLSIAQLQAYRFIYSSRLRGWLIVQ